MSLVLRASQDRVRIFDKSGALIATHPRSFDAGVRVEIAGHLEALHATKRHASAHRGREALIARCPAAAALLGRQLELQLNLPAELRALILLCDRFGDQDVDAAIERCLSVGLARAVDVERALVDPQAALHPAPMDLDLSAYDQLTPKKERP